MIEFWLSVWVKRTHAGVNSSQWNNSLPPQRHHSSTPAKRQGTFYLIVFREHNSYARVRWVIRWVLITLAPVPHRSIHVHPKRNEKKIVRFRFAKHFMLHECAREGRSWCHMASRALFEAIRASFTIVKTLHCLWPRFIDLIWIWLHRYQIFFPIMFPVAVENYSRDSKTSINLILKALLLSIVACIEHWVTVYHGSCMYIWSIT